MTLLDVRRPELRNEAERLFSDKAQLYEIIYESRFCRLWEQFRKQGGDYHDGARTITTLRSR